MLDYMPYLVSIVTALIAYYQSNKQAKLKVEEMQKVTESEITKLAEVHKLNIKQTKELHRLELEKNEMEHRHKIELMEKGKALRVSETKDNVENKALDNVLDKFGETIFMELLNSPEIKEQLKQQIKFK